VDRLLVTWAATDPGGLADRLRTLGFALAGRDRLVFPSGEVRLIRADERHAADRLLDPRWEPAANLAGSGASRGVTSGAASRPVHPNGVHDLAALGWATIDADRTTAATRSAADFSFTTLPDDEQLGARVRGSLERRPAMLVLEPATEGRLAATLVRGGEGPAALYLVAGVGGLERLAATGWAAREVAAGAGVAARAAGIRPGPLGPALLLPGGAAWGPHLLVVAAAPSAPEGRTAGTITP
jgi:hypothetical protein